VAEIIIFLCQIKMVVGLFRNYWVSRSTEFELDPGTIDSGEGKG
jgi:hypothetical protein